MSKVDQFEKASIMAIADYEKMAGAKIIARGNEFEMRMDQTYFYFKHDCEAIVEFYCDMVNPRIINKALEEHLAHCDQEAVPT